MPSATHRRFCTTRRLSAALNIGLLTPHEVCEATAQRYYTGDAPINAVEGLFTRYWDGEGMFGGSTGPKCQLIRLQTSLAFSATQMTIDNNYAHHIQRLMVTGNFALLCGIKPEALCDWYLAVYADASEWVELPNTLGMVLHAGGGLIGSKPYCASGKYIDKMSDH